MSTQSTKLTAARWLSLVIAGVLVLLPFHAFFTTWLGNSTGHLNTWRLWKEVIVIVIALPLAGYLLAKDNALRQWIGKSWLVWLYLSYVLLSFATGWWSFRRGYVSKTALADGLDINLRFIGFFIICQVAAASDNFLRRWWARLTLGPAAAVVVFGLVQKLLLPLNFLSHFGYGPKTIVQYQTVDASSGPARLQSTLRGPNPLGAYLVLIMPAWQAVFRKRRLIAYVGLAAGAVVLIYSYSRSALVAALLACLALGWWLADRRQRQWLLAGLAAMAIIVGGFLYADRNSHFVQESIFHTSSTSSSPKTSNTVRRSALKAGWNDMVNQPLGRGPGTAGPASQHNQPHKTRIAENYYLQIGQELGVLGLAIFVAINITTAWQLWLKREDVLSKVLLVSLAGISLVNMVSHAWTDDTLSMLWWGLAGIALAPDILIKRTKHENASQRK